MQKPAKICIHEKNTVLRGLLVALVSLVFSSHCVLGKDIWCHDGKFMRKNGEDCDNCRYCTLDNFNSYFGTNGDAKTKNETDRYCPGFGDEDDTFATVHSSLPKDVIKKLKEKMLPKHDCKASSQFGVRSCSEDFDTEFKHYVSAKLKSTEGKTNVYTTCKLKSVYCEAGFSYKKGSVKCDYSCSTFVDPVKCPAGWHDVDSKENYEGVLCTDNTIPKQDRSDCCKCPDGYAPNDKDITVFSDGSNTGKTVFKGRVCVNKEYKNETSLKDTPELIWRCETSKPLVEKLSGTLPKMTSQLTPVLGTALNMGAIGIINNGSGNKETTTEPAATPVNVECTAGQIWNPQAGKCEACTSRVEWINYANENRMFCPGVTDTKLPVLQQLQKCPAIMQPNHNLSGCDCIWGTKSSDGKSCKNVTLSKENLKCGPAGCNAPLFKQCWTKTTAAAYKKCMGFD